MKSNTNNNNALAVGIDIGGTNTVFGLVDHMGNCVCQDSIHRLKHLNFKWLKILSML